VENVELGASGGRCSTFSFVEEENVDLAGEPRSESTFPYCGAKRRPRPLVADAIDVWVIERPKRRRRPPGGRDLDVLVASGRTTSKADRLAGEISTFWSLRAAKHRFSPPREGTFDVVRPVNA
jgi:hypothetical protein